LLTVATIKGLLTGIGVFLVLLLVLGATGMVGEYKLAVFATLAAVAGVLVARRSRPRPPGRIGS
jgi:hypothetical protein